MRKILAAIAGLFALTSAAFADQVLVIDAQYSTVTQNVRNRLEAVGHTVTVTTDVSQVPTTTGAYQQVWDLRYAAALTAGEQTNYQTFITNGGFAYFVTENPGCCMARNDSVAALVMALGGGNTTIGANFGMVNNVSSNVNTTYMTSGITVNYAAASIIVNSQGIPLISDSAGNVSGMSWIGRAGALSSGVTGTIVTVADTNWLDQSRFNTAQNATIAEQQNVTALDDIIRGIVAGTVGGTINSNGNGSAATNGGGAPTVVSTAVGTPTVSSSNSDGQTTTSSTSSRGTTITVSNTTASTTTYTASAADTASRNKKTIDVTRTTTVVGATPMSRIDTLTTPITTVTTQTTPRTTTTVTTPQTVTTYSDGSTITTAETPVTTASTQNIIVTTTTTQDEVTTQTTTWVDYQSASSNETHSASAASLNEITKFKSFNPFLVDALSSKDGGWITPSASYYKSIGGVRSGGVDLGFHKTIDNNSMGVAFRIDSSSSTGYLNSKTEATSYTGTIYALTKQNYGWWKLSVGINRNDYSSTVSIPQFGLINGTKMNQTNYYADIGAYSPITIIGIRPLAGVVINNSVISDIRETGSPLLSTAPNVGSTITANPYFGGRYEFNKSVYFESKLIYDKEYKVVSSNRLGVKTDIYKNMSLELGAGLDKGSEYTGIIGTAGVKWKF